MLHVKFNLVKPDTSHSTVIIFPMVVYSDQAYEKIYSARPIVVRGEMQGGHADVVDHVDVGAGIEKDLDALDAPLRLAVHDTVKWRPTFVVLSVDHCLLTD